ncbi:hypothetical protein B7G68_21030 [Caulobacter segnis]|uniref:FABP family protein n=1 Tax=Caulobacter segnis TaxID=88688 RepID=A0ABN5IZ49_9CAUL|nr:hypothetical protein B7G68_21030 [Caulobacter segnis]
MGASLDPFPPRRLPDSALSPFIGLWRGMSVRAARQPGAMASDFMLWRRDCGLFLTVAVL